jgi:lipoate-protein ligase A
MLPRYSIRQCLSLKRFYTSHVAPKTKLRILHSNSNDPFINLATEDWIFNECDPSYQYLYLWRNDKTVVIGKHQNPFKECHLQRMEEDNVHLTRRRSGGGAVYQDLGNTIFTFLSPKAQYDKAVNFGVLTRALKEGFGIGAQVSGRNDMVISGDTHPQFANRKISGCAFKIGADRAFHHGTLLVDLDLNALQRYLNPHKLKLQSKGVTSVISRVVNLKEINPEITHDTLNGSIVQSFLKQYNEQSNVIKVEEIDQRELLSDPAFQKYHKELRDWDWRFGKTPEFSNNFETRFDWGLVDVYIKSQLGVIESVKIFSDTLFPIVIELFEKELRGRKLSNQDLNNAVRSIESAIDERTDIIEKQVIRACIDDLARFIISNI